MITVVIKTPKSNIAGWSSLVARRAHNPKVVGSNPAPATILKRGFQIFGNPLFNAKISLMKKVLILLFVFILMSQVSYSAPQIRFCESVFPYKNGILIPNYGSDNIKARSDEYKGYILFLKNNKLHNFIPPNGILKQPTAMTVYKNNLFICDCNLTTGLICTDTLIILDSPLCEGVFGSEN